MKYFIEKHIYGYCIVNEFGGTVNEGKPHMRQAMYFDKKKDAEAYIKELK